MEWIGLAALKQKYGPVVWLNLGPVKTMVIPSAGAAEELFKNHDLSFADRSINDSMRSHEFYKSSMVLCAFSIYWRTLRRICTVELFSTKRISETVLIRQKCVDKMLLWIEKEAEKGANGGIEVLKFVFPATFNLIGNLTVSRDLMDPYSEMASEFQMALSGFSECLGSPNISDFAEWVWRIKQLLGLESDNEVSEDKSDFEAGLVNNDSDSDYLDNLFDGIFDDDVPGMKKITWPQYKDCEDLKWVVVKT
ncbi:hypothetical protein POM88_027312 [Heracleum sosnowskyi]|uniref:Cytochrome P450 n=1 Tax=Heracleum sosnowskyi TaxID=360622 RepID=A0AAD8MQV6_9APIA|nr:hypothetical protein POM88_027312 [Heracleum sosnowskyi]